MRGRVVVPAPDAIVKMAVKDRHYSRLMPPQDFIKTCLPVHRFHIPGAVRRTICVYRNVRANDHTLFCFRRRSALGLDPCQLLLGYKPVVRIGASIAEHDDANGLVRKANVDRLANVLRKKLRRIVIARNLVNLFPEPVPNLLVDRILLLASPIHDVAQMQDKIDGLRRKLLDCLTPLSIRSFRLAR
ncbi:MAG: hypothetical protein ACI9VS_001409 [Candidatus Binatia bacterium]|jgi:hypothetical protein